MKMKNLLFIFILITNICVGQDIKLIESKVCDLYSNYCKKRNIKAVVRTELDSLSNCQSRYIITLDYLQSKKVTVNTEPKMIWLKFCSIYF